MLGCEVGHELVVVDDAALARIDQEHLSRLQASLADHLRRIDVDHADLGRHDHLIVVGHPVAAWAKTVAVEHSADHGAVGEGHRGGAVPRLHGRGVEIVEVALWLWQVVVTFPRLGNHHEDRVVERVAAEMQELEGFVEARRVGRRRGADREQLFFGTVPVGRSHDALASPHPVAVAHDGVDLTVVGDEPVRVCERPRRERIRREPRVNEAEPALDPIVVEFGIELGELRCGQHALVDECPTAQAREVERSAELLGELVLDPLAGHVHQSIEVEAFEAGIGGRGEEDLLERRHDTARLIAERIGVGRHRSPCHDGQSFVGGNLLDRTLRFLADRWLRREESHPRRVVTSRWKFGDERPEEAIRHLDHHSSAVAGVGFRIRGAPVLQAAKRAQRCLDDVVARSAVEVGDEGDAACIVLERRVVETLGQRKVRQGNSKYVVWRAAVWGDR